MSLLSPPGSMGKPQTPNTPTTTVSKTKLGASFEGSPPKCFGTDYFGKWNMTGMTFESMKIDKPEYQMKCANCPLFERCYLCNHIRMLKIKR